MKKLHHPSAVRAGFIWAASVALVALLLTAWHVDAQLAAGTVRIRTSTDQSITLGQKTMANSVPVVLPSDQTVSTTQGALTSIATGQQAVTATAAALPANAGKRICLKILAAGTQTVYFGPSSVTTATGQELQPGDAWCGPLDNSNRISVIAGATGSTVAFDVLN